MKITELYVDRFDVWRDLALSSFEPGLNVVYGPNETGKSTLMRFIRGMLYGFTPPADPAGAADADYKGSLRIEHDGRRFDVDRSLRRGAIGTLSINGWGDGPTGEAAVESLLSGTTESMFQRLFAVDLLELQELATLHGDELAERVYGLTLGLEGQSILGAWTHLSMRQDQIIQPEDGSGRIAELLERKAQLSGKLESVETLRDRHAVLNHERDELQADVERRKRRRQQLQRQQQGHRFLQQVWPAWKRVQELQGELERLPEHAGFPEDGVARLAELDEEIDSLTRCHKTLVAEARQIHTESQALETDNALLRHAADVEALCDQRGRLEQLTREVSAAEKLAAAAKQQWDEAFAGLGQGWTEARLQSADVSPAAQLQLIDAARSYHGRLDRRSKVRKAYKLRAAACSRQTRELHEQRKSAGGRALAEQIEAAERRLADLDEVTRLKARETELEQQLALIERRVQLVDERPLLPAWAYVVLGIFAVLGIVFSLVGFYTGLTFNGMMGLMYALLGISCGGTAYALKTHVESTVGESRERLSEEFRESEVLLRETRSEIARRLEDVADDVESVSRETLNPLYDMPDRTVPELIGRQAQQLAELQRLAEAGVRNARRRQQLTDWRGRLRQTQRDVVSARQAWFDVLRRLGLSETLRVDEAFADWQRVTQARGALRKSQTAERELAVCRRPLDELRAAIDRVASNIGWDNIESDDPQALLDVWNEQLQNARQQCEQRRTLRRTAKGRLREAGGYRRRIARCEFAREALLMQAGTSSREEFEERAAQSQRREELAAELQSARAELESASGNEPELAIVEEDLLAYCPDDNADQLEAIAAELDELDGDLQQLFERIGSVKQEIADLEADRCGASLRFDGARVEEQLQQAAEDWFAAALSRRALSAVQKTYERQHQPSTLKAAAKYLARMTRGRYNNIWTPLGTRRLSVDDETGRSFNVEQLSGGTREQLFLAIRLAIVDELSSQGVELPMVLDDVFANFDESRTAAAADALLDFAASGQQILLLTCHVHLAKMLEDRGVHAIWLPDNAPRIEERRAG